MTEHDETQRIEPTEPTRVIGTEPTARFDVPPPAQPPHQAGRPSYAVPPPPAGSPAAGPAWTPPPLPSGLGQPPAGAPGRSAGQGAWTAGYPQASTGPYPAAAPYGQPGYPGYPQPGYPQTGQPGYPGYPQPGHPGYPQPGTPQPQPSLAAGPYARYAQPSQAGYHQPPPYNPYGQYPAGPQWPAPGQTQPRRGVGRLILVLALALAVTITGFAWALRPILEQSVKPVAPSVEPAQPQEPAQPAQPGTEPETSQDPNAPISAGESVGVVFVEGQTSGGIAAGTGMVLTPDGKILTNYHVVAGTQSLQVTIADSGDSYPATVLGFDQTKDVALLQLADASGLATVTLDNDEVAVGDAVAAVGNAGGHNELVRAAGKVTGLDRSLTVSSDSPWGSQEDLSGVIETTAGAVPGHSGGPMFDDEAEVVGITTAGSTQAGRSYAVPIADALAVVDTIEAGRDVGTVRVGPAGYLGIVIGKASRYGVLITDVVADSPAGRAGMEVGSTLVRVGETEVNQTTNMATVIRGLEPGDQVTIEWLTPSGKERQASVVLEASPVN